MVNDRASQMLLQDAGLEDKGEVKYDENQVNLVALHGNPDLRIAIARMTNTISRVYICDKASKQRPVTGNMVMEEDGRPCPAIADVFYISRSSSYKLSVDGKVVLSIDAVHQQRLRAPPECASMPAE